MLHSVKLNTYFGDLKTTLGPKHKQTAFSEFLSQKILNITYRVRYYENMYVYIFDIIVCTLMSKSMKMFLKAGITWNTVSLCYHIF